jgi:hypothetical protein
MSLNLKVLSNLSRNEYTTTPLTGVSTSNEPLKNMALHLSLFSH